MKKLMIAAVLPLMLSGCGGDLALALGLTVGPALLVGAAGYIGSGGEGADLPSPSYGGNGLRTACDAEDATRNPAAYRRCKAGR